MLQREFVRFGIVGATNLVLNIAIFNLILAATSMHAGVASAISAVLTTISSYFMNKNWTYRHRPGSAVRLRAVGYGVINGIGMGIEAGLVALAVSLDPSLLMLNVVKLAAIGIAMLFRFQLYRRVLFTEGPPHPSSERSPRVARAARMLRRHRPDGSRRSRTRREVAPADH